MTLTDHKAAAELDLVNVSPFLDLISYDEIETQRNELKYERSQNLNSKNIVSLLVNMSNLILSLLNFIQTIGSVKSP